MSETNEASLSGLDMDHKKIVAARMKLGLGLGHTALPESEVHAYETPEEIWTIWPDETDT